jgi:hypothetical protein
MAGVQASPENELSPNPGDTVEVVLRGTVEVVRQDADGLKVCLRGDGFYIWVAAQGRDVRMSQVEQGDS